MLTKKRIAKDVFLNVIASALPVVLLQIFLFPSLAFEIGSELYGFVIAIYSMFSLAPGSFGNALNNVRLVHQTDWHSEADSNFNVLLLITGVLSASITIAYALLNGLSEITPLVLIALTSLCWIAREFGSVAFRLVLDFWAICINSFVMCAGYLIGYLVFMLGGGWGFIFLFGQLLSCIYIFKKTDFYSAGFKVSTFFKQIAKETMQLEVSVFIARVVVYCDRLILYPLMGGTAVAIYYSATVISKLVNLGTASLNSVVLSYLSKQKTDQRKRALLVLLVGFVVCVVFYGLILLTAPLILTVLYPQFTNDSLLLVPITAATSLIAVLSSLLNPYLLKFRSMSWQLLMPSLSLIVYVVLTLLLFMNFGLLGFCVGALITEILKLLVQLLIYLFAKPL